jgi:hypothetical protein
MLKHEECAAAMSSSGVVTDVEPSLRAFQFTGSGPWLELSRATSPDPSVRLPFQEVVASLVTLIVSSVSAVRARRGPRGQPNGRSDTNGTTDARHSGDAQAVAVR